MDREKLAIGAGVLVAGYFARKYYTAYEQKQYCKANPGACGTDCLTNPDDPGCWSLNPNPTPAPAGNFLPDHRPNIPGKNQFAPKDMTPNQLSLAGIYCDFLSYTYTATPTLTTAEVVANSKKDLEAQYAYSAQDMKDWEILNSLAFNTLQNSCFTCNNKIVVAKEQTKFNPFFTSACSVYP